MQAENTHSRQKRQRLWYQRDGFLWGLVVALIAAVIITVVVTVRWANLDLVTANTLAVTSVAAGIAIVHRT